MEQKKGKSEKDYTSIHREDEEKGKKDVISSPSNLPPASLIENNETQQPGYITANPITYKWVKKFREKLKKNPTEAEQLLWKYLTNKQTGHKIRRQHVIGDFIADFVCLPKKVIIEIDGEIHKKQKIEDNIRTIALNNLGYEVIRFSNEEVFLDPAAITAKIKAYLDSQQT